MHKKKGLSLHKITAESSATNRKKKKTID